LGKRGLKEGKTRTLMWRVALVTQIKKAIEERGLVLMTMKKKKRDCKKKVK